jgi:hypothetical protein
MPIHRIASRTRTRALAEYLPMRTRVKAVAIEEGPGGVVLRGRIGFED